MSTLASERATRSISWVSARNWRLAPISSAVPLRVIRPRPIGTAWRRPLEWRPNCRFFELWLIRNLLVQGTGQSRLWETFSPKPLFFEELRVSWWSSESVQFRSVSLPKRDTDDKSLPIGRLPVSSSVNAGQTFVGRALGDACAAVRICVQRDNYASSAASCGSAAARRPADERSDQRALGRDAEDWITAATPCFDAQASPCVSHRALDASVFAPIGSPSRKPVGLLAVAVLPTPPRVDVARPRVARPSTRG